VLPFDGGSDALPLPQVAEREPVIDSPVTRPDAASEGLTEEAGSAQGMQEHAVPAEDGPEEGEVLPDESALAEDRAPFATNEQVGQANAGLPMGEEPAADASQEPGANGGSSVEVSPARLDLDWVRGNWRQVLLRIKPLSPQIQALLNSVEPIQVSADVITLGCRFGFHRDKLSESKNRGLVEQVLSQVLGVSCRVTCVVHAVQAETADKDGLAQRRPGDLFSANDPHGDERQELLNHPVVKELERRGGRVSKVSLNEEDQEDRRGQ
jgi:hypothetical protein